MTYIIRNLHFIVIHVPIAMLLFSFVFDALALVLRKKEWHTAGFLCLIVGTLGSIAAVMTGPEGERNPIFPRHELFGKITMVFFILVAAIRIWFYVRRKLELGRSPTYLAAALIGVLLVSYNGHLGGKMVHPDRKAPEGRFEGRFPQQQNTGNDRPTQGGQQDRQIPSGQNGETAPERNGAQ
jgi:uncharacterized membrane protein